MHIVTVCICTYRYCHSRAYILFSFSLVPCAPEGVKVSVSCITGTANVQWLRSAGALSYTATLEQLNGTTYCCNAVNGSTSCNVTALPCGQLYSVTVTATGRTCNSSQSTPIMVQTGSTIAPTSLLLLPHTPTNFYTFSGRINEVKVSACKVVRGQRIHMMASDRKKFHFRPERVKQ